MQARKLNLKRTTRRGAWKYHLHAMEYQAGLHLPAMIDLRPQDVPIFDQGDMGSCTGQGWGALVDFIQQKQLREGVPLGHSPEEFSKLYSPVSRLFIYYNERMDNGDPNSDDGAEINDGAVAIGKYGVCRESLWTYVDHHLLMKPGLNAYQEALNHKIMGAYEVAGLQDIKQSLYNGYPVVIGVAVYDSMMSDEVAATGVVPMPDLATEQCQGGHCMEIVGYDDAKQVVYVRNSWGTDWGMKGYCTFPYAYIQNPQLMDDARTLRV